MCCHQGYGYTTTSSSGDEAATTGTVTVLSQEQCRDMWRHNASLYPIVQRRLSYALPNGIDYGLLCAQGILENVVNQLKHALNRDLNQWNIFLHMQRRQWRSSDH